MILTLGGKHGTCSMASMGEGIDSTDINLPKCQDAFIRKAAQLGNHWLAFTLMEDRFPVMLQRNI